MCTTTHKFENLTKKNRKTASDKYMIFWILITMFLNDAEEKN